MRFQCPYCRGIVAVDNSDLGIDVQCGHCHEIVTVPSSRVATGAVIADFIILQKLGRGGMGIVYLVHQISLDRPAALKILSDHYANNAEFVVGFIKEARAAAKLNHPHIVQAYAVGEDEGIFYFAMENVDGETMKSVLKRERVIPVEQSLAIIQQVSEALDYAWKEQRLIHRDIKPDNIMLTSNGRAKLADLGLARVAGEIDDSEDDEVMGTPQYISPEHLTGAPMDIRSDIYSLGATFFHFVTGKFPFEGRTATEIARKHLEDPLPSPKKFNPSIPENVCLIIEKMMAKSPKDRYQDAEQLVDDLRQVRRGKRPNILAATSSTGGLTRVSTGSLRKTILINTKQKTGTFRATDGTGSLPTATGPLTGAIPTSTTGLHSKTSVHNLKRLHEEQAKRKLIALLVFCGAAIAMSIGAIFWSLSKKPAPPPQAPATTSATQPTPQQPGTKSEPNSTPYTMKASEIVAYAKAHPQEGDNIFRMCEDFLVNFPEPKYRVETEKLQDLLTIFVPIDEKRITEPRKNIRDAFEKVFKEKQSREKKLLEEERKRIAEESKRKREEAEKARQEKLRAQKEEKDFKAHTERLSAEKDAMRLKFIEMFQRRDFKEIPSIFKNAMNEEAAAKDKPERFAELAASHSEWAKKMAEGAVAAQKIEKLLTDSGTEMAGSQIEIKGTFGRITNIRNGVVTVNSFTNKTISAPVSQIPQKQFVNLAKKAAGMVGSDESAVFYFIASADFILAKDIVSTLDMQTELSACATAYFKEKLKDASDPAKAELQKNYSSMEEFKKVSETK